MSESTDSKFVFIAERFNMKNIKHNKVFIIIGKRHSGKSHLLEYILYHMQTIPVGIVVSRTEYMNKNYKKFIPAACLKHEYSDKLLSQFVSRQMDETDKCEEEKTQFGYSSINPEAFLIFDDVLDDTKWCTNTDIKFIFYNGRHAQITFFLCMQHPMGIPPSLRTQADYVFIFNDENIENRQKIYKQYCGMFPSFAIFNKVMRQLTGDYRCIVIDNTNQFAKNINEKVFWYKAPNKIPPFKMCTEALWSNNDSNWQLFRKNVRVDREEKAKETEEKKKAKKINKKNEVLIELAPGGKRPPLPGMYIPGIDPDTL